MADEDHGRRVNHEYPRSSRERPPEWAASEAGIDLYWLPLGAGGWFVRLNGRIYEAIQARPERRTPLDLYHSALEVHVPKGRFVIEQAWPIPTPMGHRAAWWSKARSEPAGCRFRACRYEVRRWRDGVIADADEAVASPQRLTHDPQRARLLLDLVDSLPRPTWGRDELGNRSDVELELGGLLAARPVRLPG